MILNKTFGLTGFLLVCFIGMIPVSCVADEARVLKKNEEKPPKQKKEKGVESEMLKDLDLFLNFELIEMMEIFQEEKETPSEGNPQNQEETP
ncbi:MAG TPA: hypothetical protein VGB26_08470 [Nitrospiria bacterium]